MDRYRSPRPIAALGLVLLTAIAAASTALAQSGSASKPTAWLGVYLRDVDREDVQALDLADDVRGVMVSGIDDEGPGAKAGIEPGDVVTQFDGKPVQDRADFMQKLSVHAPGDRVELSGVRGRNQRTFTVVLGSRPEGAGIDDYATDAPATHDLLRRLSVSGPTLGVRTLDLETDELAAYFGVEAQGGVLVTGLVEGSGAEKAGVQAGDVILAVDDRPVHGTADIRTALRDHQGGDRVNVRLKRKNAEQTLAVELGEGLEVSRWGLPMPDRTWRFNDDLGDLRRELEDLKRDVRRLERDLRRQR
jgi:serine protease Do